MKKSTLAISTLLSVASFSTVAAPIKVSCEFKVRKNKTSLSELKESSIKKDFILNEGEVKKPIMKFKRVVPFLNSEEDNKKAKQKNLVKRKSERVILFKSDKSEEEIDNSILYGLGKVKGRLIARFTYVRETEDGDKVVQFRTMNPLGTLHDKSRLKNFVIEPGDSETIEMKEAINFQYTDYSYKGFLGISGWFNDEVEVTGESIHKGEIYYKCKISAPEMEEILDDEGEVDSSGGDAEEIQGFQIERNAPTVNEE